MPAGLTEPAGAAPPAGVGASGTVTMAPAAALPVRVESTPVALGAVTKAPVSVCVESTASQPLRSPVGTLVTKVAPVSALPKLSSGPRLPAPQIVAVKAPNTTTIQLPANLQLPPGTVLIKSNSGQLMLVSPQQAVTRTETTSNITSRPAVPTNTQTVKICTMQNSSSQLIKKVAVAPVKQLAQIGTTVVTTVPKPSPVQSVAVPTSVVTVTPAKPLNTVATLKPSSLGAPPTPSSEPSLTAENSATAQTNLSPTMLENVKKCKNFLAMLIKLACSGSQSPEMGQNVKKLVEQLLDAKIEAEEFTRQLYVELKSSPQPHLVPFLKVVQQPSGGLAKQVTTFSHSSALTIQKSGQKKVTVSTAVPTSQFPQASILKQITLPGNKVLSLQSSIQKNKIKENGTTSFRDEDDINDVTSMAGVNLSEENACILATNSELVGTLVQSCKDEPFLFIGALQKRILDIGKKHDITELNSDAVNLISHATQERLRGLLEKLTTIAQHRMTTYKASENYILSNDTRSQLKFLEKLDQLEKQRKDVEEREMLLKAAKSRSNKEDPEQLRLKQKAKELQQLELAQIQHRDANLTALAAIGPRKKRPLESGSGSEGFKDNLFASGTSSLTATKQLLRPRITRICLRDLIFCMEQEREMKYSRALYLALLK
ncbi:transcription initiation factor TFIID subunit 4B isoform X3 [Balaenoptera ricei]|uniref:transcription initiation factor TFIID subunit 4B isoform X3 n=1 Tax=Balaenoptera ricei TaxID=2746895 RepID=UPI0028BF57A4|nr:transcription initiation factor TFIID subunit 4B isoform X3 [Balaenoptera ricei]